MSSKRQYNRFLSHCSGITYVRAGNGTFWSDGLESCIYRGQVDEGSNEVRLGATKRDVDGIVDAVCAVGGLSCGRVTCTSAEDRSGLHTTEGLAGLGGA